MISAKQKKKKVSACEFPSDGQGVVVFYEKLPSVISSTSPLSPKHLNMN